MAELIVSEAVDLLTAYLQPLPIGEKHSEADLQHMRDIAGDALFKDRSEMPDSYEGQEELLRKSMQAVAVVLTESDPKSRLWDEAAHLGKNYGLWCLHAATKETETVLQILQKAKPSNTTDFLLGLSDDLTRRRALSALQNYAGASCS